MHQVGTQTKNRAKLVADVPSDSGEHYLSIVAFVDLREQATAKAAR